MTLREDSLPQRNQTEFDSFVLNGDISSFTELKSFDFEKQITPSEVKPTYPFPPNTTACVSFMRGLVFS